MGSGEGIDDARRALAIARELAYPAGELLALADLSLAALYAGDFDEQPMPENFATFQGCTPSS